VGDVGLKPAPSGSDGGFGLVSIVVSLLIVALLSVGALKAFASGASSGSGSPTLNPTVSQAYDVQAQTALSNAMQNLRDSATSNGALAASDLAQFGVVSGPSTSPSTVSGAVSDTTSGAGGPLGFGSVTLAAEAKSGTCWFTWFSSSATWYGFEPDATSCVAPSMATEPTPGAGGPGTIGWQQGSFPTTG
jgi:hypothetical protein